MFVNIVLNFTPDLNYTNRSKVNYPQVQLHLHNVKHRNFESFKWFGFNRPGLKIQANQEAGKFCDFEPEKIKKHIEI